MTLIRRIGLNGMSNANYLLFNKCVIRFPFSEYDGIVDRKAERIAKKIAGKCPIAQFQTVALNNGVAIREYIPGDSAESAKPIEDRVIAIVDMCMNMLHSYSYPNIKRYLCNKHMNVFKRLDYILDNVIRKKYANHRQIDAFNKIRKVLESYDSTNYVLCHGDMMPSNIIIGEYGIARFIDFEFACICDPVYDIACFGNQKDIDGLKLLKYHCAIYDDNDMYQDMLKRFYMWRYVQTYQWLNVARYKTDRTVDTNKQQFFANYANVCSSRLAKYIDILKEMEVI